MLKINENNINTPEYWDSVYLSEASTSKKRIDRDRFEFLSSYIGDWKQYNVYQEKIDFIDIGCGNGEMMRLVHAYWPELNIHGLDFCEKIIQDSQTHDPNFEYRVGSITEIPYEDELFDIIFCGETIEHVDNPVKSVKELFRVCKPGGYVIITTPNEHNNYSPEHIHEFTVKDILDILLLCKAELRDIRVICSGLSIAVCAKK